MGTRYLNLWPLHIVWTVIYSFVNAHLTAHAKYYSRRLRDYKHLVKTMLFSPVSRQGQYSTIYDTTHLFFFGDLNFRLTKPGADHLKDSGLVPTDILHLNDSIAGRRELRQHDQLSRAQREGKTLLGLREGELEQFPLTYKYVIGTLDTYRYFLKRISAPKLVLMMPRLSSKRMPSWTDRILYTTASDTELPPPESNIKNLLYTSILAFTKSDHKPITAILLVPPSSTTNALNRTRHDIPPLIKLPPHSLDLSPDPRLRLIARCVGKLLDWFVGWVWCFLWFIGAGNAGIGVGTFVLGTTGAIAWWKRA